MIVNEGTPKSMANRSRRFKPSLNPLMTRLLGLLVAIGAMVALGAMGCGQTPKPSPADNSVEQERRFQFVRATKLILRLDTQLGVVWKVAENGDGGWAMLGATPDDAGEPNWNGRYGLFPLKSGMLGGSPQLLRVDRATGRAWLAVAREGSQWTPILDGPPVEPEAFPAGAATGGANPGPVVLPVVPKATVEAAPGEEAEKILVVTQALEKPGLALEIKVWAAHQLAVFSPESAVPPLLVALESEHPEVVVAAIQSLKKIGQTSTIPKILALGQHPNPDVRAAVQTAVAPVP